VTLDWEKIYREFTASATDEDCGGLCRNGSRTIAACCDARLFSLITYADELAFARPRTTCWHRKRPQTAKERRTVASWVEYIVPARCVQPRHCDRPYRSLTCRFFPLEPYIDARSRFIGLTYVYGGARHCPLIRREADLRQEFVDQCVAVWRLIFATYPDERRCYADTSRRLRARFTRQGRRIRVFRPTAAAAELARKFA
jgi:hypothetical protein